MCRHIITYYKTFCALSWLFNKIILRCTVSKTSKNEWRVLVAKLEGNDVTAIGLEDVNWSRVDEERDQCRYRVIA